MAIIMRQELQGLTDEQAAAIAAVVNARAKTAPGFIAHASGPMPGGYQITEFWESREAFERFSDAVVGPLMGQLGVVPPQSPAQYTPVENVVTR
jgi:hypothetical protein